MTYRIREVDGFDDDAENDPRSPRADFNFPSD
jgi:hypothetical protein